MTTPLAESEGSHAVCSRRRDLFLGDCFPELRGTLPVLSGRTGQPPQAAKESRGQQRDAHLVSLAPVREVSNIGRSLAAVGCSSLYERFPGQTPLAEGAWIRFRSLRSHLQRKIIIPGLCSSLA